jgi:hypothetical protein
MKSILLVDEQREALDGLERMLFALREHLPTWPSLAEEQLCEQGAR